MRTVRLVLPALLLAAILIVPTSVTAQSNDEWYLNKPIWNIEFQGLRTVSPSELSAITDPFRGQPFTEQRFLDLQRRLYALDYFEQIIPNAVRRAAGDDSVMILRFEVRERPTITEIELIGNRRVGRNQILDAILLKRGDMVTQSKVRIDEEAIRALYLERGFPTVTLSSEIIRENETVKVRFNINEGNQVSIQEINFVGNSFAGAGTLRGVIESKARNIFNRGLFQAATVEMDRTRIQRWYFQRGYVDARVVEVDQQLTTDPDAGRAYLSLTFFIEEGRQYTYGGIEFEGNTIFTSDELRNLIRLRPGDVLDLTRFEVDYQRVVDRYYENGYIFNQIARTEFRDEEENVISFLIEIVERSRAHIENIIIRGNDKTRDYVIRREIPLEVGDVFSATRIRTGMQNLANLQFFSGMTPETPQGSADGLMDLIINIEEGNTAEISFGVAFGGNQEFPISAQIQWQDRNFLGRGQTFGIQAIASPISQQVTFNFTERWLANRRWSAGVNLSFDRTVISNVPMDTGVDGRMYTAQEYRDGVAVPDPYGDRWVFSRDTVIGGVTYRAGQEFPGTPTAKNIADYGLVTAYAWQGGSNASIPSDNLMSYDAYSIGLGASTGYTFRTPVGRFTPRTSARTSLDYISYDQTLYRPFNPATRANLDTWKFRNSWSIGAALDQRDLFYSPSRGYRLDQGFTFVGGWLLGERHYTRTDSLAEFFYTLLDGNIGAFRTKGVLALQTAFSMILPNFYLNSSSPYYFVVTDVDYVRRDGMFNARGWSFERGEALWNSWLELRMPLSEQVIWFDGFIEGARLYRERDEIGKGRLKDFTFTMGAGIRFVIPQFPVRLYLAKRFQFDEAGNVVWQPGNLFRGEAPGSGIDLIFTIGAEFF